MLKVLNLFNGFLITTTYRGIIVVVSQNVHQYLGYTELDLLGQNLMNITHEGDRAMLREQLMPRSQTLGPNGELMIMDEPDAIRKAEDALAQEKRRFIIRLKKLGQRSEPNQYITCHVEGSLRKSDRACRGYSRCCQIVRRARARSENPCSSGNDIVFIGVVRPTSETFINESALESYRMEYRTRHSIDGEIIQCEARIALVTGYMTHEVSGVNAMNFMHRDDVRWVIIALREMYDQHRLFGESCYRLIAKNGQSIYMRTRGCLDVDQESRAVTSFVCTNTVVDEEEGKHLIKLMKKKFTMMVNSKEDEAPVEKPECNEIAPPPVVEGEVEELEEEEEEEEEDQYDDDQAAPVEDPRRLEQVILHLVTNLPSPSSQDSDDEGCSAASSEKSMSPHRLTIIPPNKERIVSAIEKIYSVIKYFQRGSRRRQNVIVENGNGGQNNNRNKPTNINIPVMNSVPVTQTAPVAQYDTSQMQYNNVQAPENPVTQPMSYDASGNPVLNNTSPTDYVNYEASPSPFSNLAFLYPSINNSGEDLINQQRNSANDNNYRATETATAASISGYEEAASVLQTMPQPSSSTQSCGVKRPNESEDFDMVHKKKVTEHEYARQHEQTSDLPTSLDHLLFDESLFNIEEIESVISSWEWSPSFLDSLISTDVQEFLGQIEKEAEEQQLQVFDTSEYE
uniref:PAS domain-containing protein n=1 Tax=Heliothis virescens TaxID=7102 RepID=A0A2A4IU13_HELVI